MQLRKLVANEIARGKVELYISLELSNSQSNFYINTELVKDYYNQIKDFQKRKLNTNRKTKKLIFYTYYFLHNLYKEITKNKN